jgi:hypothetical protein
MSEATLTQELAFVMAHQQEDEEAVLARAMREGIRLLYRETLIEAYLLGHVSRQDALVQLGPDVLEEVEYQRDALKRDVVWGMSDA